METQMTMLRREEQPVPAEQNDVQGYAFTVTVYLLVCAVWAMLAAAALASGLLDWVASPSILVEPYLR